MVQVLLDERRCVCDDIVVHAVLHAGYNLTGARCCII